MKPTAVAFLIFNRPDLTQVVFNAIRQAQPSTLLVVADGPRPERPDEAENCAKVRSVIEQVDWDCHVLTNFSETNLGCKKRISSGLDWVFNTVEEAIILEDDCLPHPTFFRFCQELLNHYRDDTRIMAISGDNFQFGRRRTQDSYYFSRYNHCWGWASWRRAWQYYDVEMKLWPIVKQGNWLKDILQNETSAKNWTEPFQQVYENLIDTWDYQLTFACWVQSGLSILPNFNLVSNIGFGREATHTTNNQSQFSNIPVEAMEFPLIHPKFVIRDYLADRKTEETLFKASHFHRLKQKIKTLLHQLTQHNS
jgi:hypothetical protein